MRPAATLLLPLLAVVVHGADRVYDEVIDLPGVTFDVRFKHYSGYLDATPGNHLHYWFFESQSNPAQAPLILWLNGGPGCSSISGSLTENGPFHPTKDGEHLQENVFAWNKVLNVLYIDSPRDVGYSYRDTAHPADHVYNNTKTTDDLVVALQSFVTAYPEFKFRDFFITGESYGGIYIPQLVQALIQTDSVQLNLKGFAIGNGLMRLWDSFNSDIDLMYYRGMIGKHEFDSLYDCCLASGQTADLLYCDFAFFLELHDSGAVLPKKFDDPALNQCAAHIVKLGNYVWFSKNSPYNTYQDCYVDKPTPPKITTSNSQKSFSNWEDPFYDQGANQFADSTDAMGGFPCYMDDATEKYLNLPEVRNALHIRPDTNKWVDCRNIPYLQNEMDMTDVFDFIVDSGVNLRALIYNGDLDLADSFMADQWFIERLAERKNLKVVAERDEWVYQRSSKMPPAGGGYVKRFANDTFAIDLLQVKGAGHLVPTDRPGPALQMINNFIFGLKSYDNVPNIPTDPAPLLKLFQSAPEPALSRKEADRIYDLPGLTFKLNFHHYAGYLNGIKGNYLHYWFVESQRDPEHDPLVLWLSGGPGCSGYTALLWGNGPFRPNRDGTTLSENVYSWNKIANVIFIDSPRGVGYSFQNTTENPSKEWNDDLTAEDLKLALLDFLEVFPEYKHRPFYLTGESYGGVYVPSTAVKLIELIQAGDLPYLKFEGIATGNALLSSYDNFNAQLQYQYFHGAIGKDDWDALQQCCPKGQHPADPAYFEFCDFAKTYITFDEHGEAQPKDAADFCGQRTVNITVDSAWAGPQTQFNLYASCYELRDYGSDRPELIKPFYAKPGFVDQARLISHEASDSQDGQFCWGQIALRTYMNTPAVQAALHVEQLEKAEIKWQGCSDPIGEAYKWQYLDMRPFFRKMIDWGRPFKFLIYNGDIDMTCNFLSGQWFAEDIAKEYSMELSKEYKQWLYLQQIGGYAEQFKYKNITMDVVTVKGAGHFAALDRPGPALQVFASLIDGKPLDGKTAANLELADLLQRYLVEETVGREKDLPAPAAAAAGEASRAKRAAVEALPKPPPACNKVTNEVIDLPGLTFDLGVKHYSGYLSAAPGDYLHYWLVEAEKDATTAPLILWFNGGPGCSSLTGLLGELGPFQNNADGETLYENIHSWHKAGNLLFLESPRGIGFSYQASDSDPKTIHDYSDTLTAEGNLAALLDFLKCYPEYKDRKLFITGESYAGVYIPTFVDLLLKNIADGTVSGVNLEGLAIGNGAFSTVKDVSSSITLSYMRGMHSRKEYEALGRCVPSDFKLPMTYYDFTNYVNIDQFGLPIPKSLNTSTLEGFCGTEVLRQGYLDVWLSKNDVYNSYQDCYVRHPLPSPGDQDASSNDADRHQKKKRSGGRVKRDAIGRPLNYSPFIDEAKRMNYQSTDNNGGIYCYDGKTPYLNRPEVRKAINIPDYYTKEWKDCEYNLELTYYKQEHNDTTPVFESIFATAKTLGKPLRMLIYHGDADMACHFLAGQWFIEELASRNAMLLTTPYTPWIYEQKKNAGMTNIGGFQKSWSHLDGKLTIDLVTVKGAGHYVPTDRPGEALQMIYNFVHNTKMPVAYSDPLWKAFPDVKRKPLKKEFIGAPSSIVSRADADRIYELPGLTFEYPYEQHSGYLQAGPGNKLFYWLFQSQNPSPTAPLLLWLNGGPGCSSLIGLFTENGPIRVNPDQRTLWENVYSWNKAAHVLYIDSPKKVGFSWQNTTENNSHLVTDDMIAPDAWLALEDFFTIFPHLKKLDFYTSGESYCGVYLPLITAHIAEKIQNKESTINLKGMIIGNGQVSFRQDMRTMPSFHYMHGIIGKDKYDALAGCCRGEDQLGGLYCHYDDFVDPITWQPYKDLNASDLSCVKALYHVAGAEGLEWSSTNDAYNLYQDCYATPKSLFSATKAKTSYKARIVAMRQRARRAAAHAAKSGMALEDIEWGNLDPLSTDNTGGYQCWMDDATITYLNMPHVRTALHVPSYVQAWDECVNIAYKTIKDDMSPQFEALLASPLNLRVLLYNGDVDDVCQLQQAQWFVEALAHKHGWNESDKTEWHYRGVIAGYQTAYRTETGFKLDLLTVKGAGHMVPTDRPGPALQFLDAFLKEIDYDTPVPYSLERAPLLHQYTRKGDRPVDLPSSTPITPSSTSVSPPVSSDADPSPSPSSTSTQSPTTTSSGAAFSSLLSLILLALLL